MTATQTHLDDGQLLDSLDDVTPRVAEHLRQCDVCTARFKAMKTASARAAAAVKELPSPRLDPRVRARIVAKPRRRPSRYFGFPLLAAATILLLASAAVAAPVRHWIARQLGVQRPPQGAEVVGPDRDRPTQTVPAPALSISFAQSDTLLTIRLLRPQVAGTLSLVRSQSGAVTAQIVGNGASEEFLVAPAALTIRNSDSSRTDYRVAIPEQVRVIHLTVGGADRIIRASSLPQQALSLSRRP